MKRLFFALALLVFLAPAARHAQAADVSIDFFYNNLDNGNWIQAGDYGYCWQPGVAANDANWRPYTDGYWAYTDVGWTWVSYEDFGWATYHYGRWARLADYGWVWVPGTEWGPAWVSWRTGGDYVGWAPLPPRRHGYREPIYEGRPITGYVDVDYDIGPAFYNFVDIRYIGEPILRERIYAADQNLGYIGHTVNVTNIAYRNGAVYNYGPDYQTLSAYSTRPIQKLRLERQSNIDPRTALQSGALTKVEGDRLLVAAPQKIARGTKDLAPSAVKAKLDKPNVETGWSGISDPQAKTQLQQKFKKENRKSIPPPQIQPTNPAALTSAGTSTDHSNHGRGKNKKEAAPANALATPAAPAAEDNRPSSLKYEKPGKNPKTQPDLTSPNQPQTNNTAAAASAATGKHSKAKGPRVTNPGMNNASPVGVANHAAAVERAKTNQAKAAQHHADAQAPHTQVPKVQQQGAPKHAARQAQLQQAPQTVKQPGGKGGGKAPKAAKNNKKGEEH
ncbi:MAG: DUF6600 domain-containing protein [Chthoniobacterales bacterium]